MQNRYLIVIIAALLLTACRSAQNDNTTSTPSPATPTATSRPTLAAVPPTPQIITTTNQTGLPTDTLLIHSADDTIISVDTQVQELQLLNARYSSVETAPDGSYVAYTDTGEPLVATHLLTGEHLILTTSRSHFTFTPDSRFLAYTLSDDRQWQIRTLDLRNRHVRTIRQEAGRVPPEHLLASPDGQHLSYGIISGDRAQVWIIDIETGNGRIVYEGAPHGLGTYPLAWAEQSLFIYQGHDRPSHINARFHHTLVQVNLTTTLTRTLGMDRWPYVAPDRQHVLLLYTFDNSISTYPTSSLSILNLQTHQTTPITPTWTDADGQVQPVTLGGVPLRKWSPDGTRLLYSWDPTSWYHTFLGLVARDGTNHQMIGAFAYPSQFPGLLYDAIWLDNETFLLLIAGPQGTRLYTLSADQFRLDALEEISQFPALEIREPGSIIYMPQGAKP